ncbi:MAG: glycosyltransferase family 4 protein [Candidatus Omnitrophica bacterium]|nr:glycosyltransferase family 4 protein [Candidatus Omnitrophota bacterium]
MKILQITSHLNVGGITRYVLSVSSALIQRGHDVAIAADAGTCGAEASQRGAAVWPVPLHTSVEFSPKVCRATRELTRRLRREEPVDVIHAHTRVAHVVADRLSRRLSIPYVTTWHGFFRPNLGRWLWPCTGGLTIAISEPVRQHLLKDFHVPEARIRLIPHGINPTPFEASIDPAQLQRLRAHVGLPSGGPVIGTVARLVPSKGVHQLLEALPHVRAVMPNARLLIIGDGEDRARLQRLADALRISDAVHFAGALPQTAAALRLMDLFVFLPAEQEGFGLSLLEAMASARPIVAVRRGGGSTWVLEQSGVGTLVEPNDPRGLASAILQTLQHGETASRAADRARAIVKERYTLTRMVEQVEAVYHDVTSTNCELRVEK